ncbi:hypothetical protein CC1G_13301 [Coprinopsis cinerea okayama7|uniref:Uncharacterized protein n=1 Tax=Coprinopsis cinerea (strain Okayama-7 / 130 / ATCC MYA-4618 / FGSC 9003) TaxID=240176 RepID=A8P0X9_COPC7|nr:hypothetical protein CC1G_13301 [Coprinopsis cinerea okayama7\|eukprot:XP_001837991.2 hypothetical protein CC1G_13301 [Coprinopsis cinerea okayama7\
MPTNDDIPQANTQRDPKSRKSQARVIRQRLAEAALGSRGATFFAECVCGRQLNTEGTYTAHIRKCTEFIAFSAQAVEENRRRLAAADPERLDVQHGQHTRKRRRLEGTPPAPYWLDRNNLDVDYGSDDLHLIEKDDLDGASSTIDDSEEINDQDPQLASPSSEHGRGKRKPKSIWLSRYADYLPSSTVPFTIPGPAQRQPAVTAQSRTNPTEEPSSEPSSSAQPPPELQIRETARNAFGLYKRFKTVEDQPHDPDLFVTPPDLHDDESAPIPPPEQLGSDTNPLHPYPNLSSFLLSEWWWKDREGKSQRDFMELISIVGNENWDAAGVRDANWGKIDRVLTSGTRPDDKEEWVDDDGTAWVTGEVTIDVPLRSKHTKRGSIPYTIPDFTYRPLMSVIRDKLSDAKDGDNFHYVPYELRWKPGESKENVQVHGELYTSPAFLDEYEKLLPAGSSLDFDARRSRSVGKVTRIRARNCPVSRDLQSRDLARARGLAAVPELSDPPDNPVDFRRALGKLSNGSRIVYSNRSRVL